MTEQFSPSRRHVLSSALAASSALALAGCLDGDDDGSDDEESTDTNGDPDDDGVLAFPEVEDPPDAVYLPTHRELMVMPDTVSAGGYRFAPMVTYAHPFWTVTGQDVEPADVSADDEIHLMVTAWDKETEMVVPIDSSISMDLRKDGESVDYENVWPMISQQMGFHFGDNFGLDGDGTYTVEGRIGGLEVRKTGEFEGRFDDAVEFEFEFDVDDELRALPGQIEYFDEEEWGEPGALEPMNHDDHAGGGHDGHDGHDDHDDHDGHDDHDDHDDGHGDDGHTGHDDDHDGHDHDEIPYSSLPDPEDLPGTLLDTPETGDAVFATTVLEPGSRFADDDEWYLAVSPRTPYNACVLPMMTLEATLEGETVSMTETLDHEFGYHYGAAFEAVEDGDELTIEVLAAPQVSRHQGYETAFVEMDDVTTTISL